VPFPRKLLNTGEDVVLDLHPHWWSLAGPVAALLAAIALGIFVIVGVDDPHQIVSIGTGVLVLVALGWFVLRYLAWVTTNFVVTTDRLIYRNGVLTKTGIEIPLDRVNTVFFSQRLFERLLGAGDLVIESAGEQGRQEFTDVRKPSAVQNEIYKQIEANENRKFDRVGRSAAAAEMSLPEQLDRLDDLRKRGVLTDEEFENKKRQLLDRM
jgi:uncharacterized membrane protein YdbT with pleckstrin-like domain